MLVSTFLHVLEKLYYTQFMRKLLLLQLTAALLCVNAMGQTGTTLLEITGENPVALAYKVDLHAGYNLLGNLFKNETTVEKLFQFSEIPLNAEVYNTSGVKLATRKQKVVASLNNGQWTYVTTAYWDVNASIPTGSAFFLRIVDYFVPGSQLKMLGSAVCITGPNPDGNPGNGTPQPKALVAGNNYIVPLFPRDPEYTSANLMTPSFLNLPLVDGMIVYTHNSAGFTCYFYEAEFGWEPSEPIFNVGTAFVVNYPSAQTWNEMVCGSRSDSVRTMIPFGVATTEMPSQSVVDLVPHPSSAGTYVQYQRLMASSNPSYWTLTDIYPLGRNIRTLLGWSSCAPRYHSVVEWNDTMKPF